MQSTMATPLEEHGADIEATGTAMHQPALPPTNDQMQEKAEHIDVNQFIDVEKIHAEMMRLRTSAAELNAECKRLRELRPNGLPDDRVLELLQAMRETKWKEPCLEIIAEADSKSPTCVYLSEC
jgi:hypothetical protein